MARTAPAPALIRHSPASVPGEYLILVEGPSPDHPDVTQRLEIIDLRN